MSDDIISEISSFDAPWGKQVVLQEIACGGDLKVWDAPGELEKHLGPIEEMWSPEMAWTLPPDEAEGS